MTLEASGVTFGYRDRPVGSDLDLTIAPGSFTAIVGPNACGKSTLLRVLSRLLKPTEGVVLLDGKAIASMPSKQVAKRLGLLPQSSTAPDGITAQDLVARGRFPHQSALRQWSRADEAAVRGAMAATGTTDLADRLVDELSGGQRQRVWVAMVLAQETELLLLDEPTTFLDIAHQIELLDIFAGLNDEGRTIVAVLHDLNQAARYATHIVAMRDGTIHAEGTPDEVITPETVEHVFNLPCKVVPDPVAGTPLVLPLPRTPRR
ncbi:ABC transporter ATP-binding protein [Glycomyces sp. NPDC046736]|uniref:ABC transporter ATP-binding protein n=1 Tax=Glycomyces sp. NPDC046736 TaxID=3155615 RepID=UPI0033D8B7FB